MIPDIRWLKLEFPEECDNLQPGTPALFMMIERATPNKAIAALTGTAALSSRPRSQIRHQNDPGSATADSDGRRRGGDQMSDLIARVSRRGGGGSRWRAWARR